jgi:hypothetical protein
MRLSAAFACPKAQVWSIVMAMSQFHQDAITAALAGDWQRAHNIVKDYDDPLACWIHAVLHKIEGDAGNSRYWYAQTAHDYADFADPRAELAAIRQALEEA